MYKTDPIWYSLLCVPVYILASPLVFIILVLCTICALISDVGLWPDGREWAYRRFTSLMHILP